MRRSLTVAVQGRSGTCPTGRPIRVKLNRLMRCILCLSVLTAAAALAQSDSAPAELAGLEQTARQRAGDWNKLAQALEPSIARLLPCDPKAAEAISAVSRASEARLAALAAYLEAARQQAARQTEAARRVLAAGQQLLGELQEGKSDLTQEQAGLEGQLQDLDASSQQKPSLGEAQAALRQVAALLSERADLAQGGTGRREALATALTGLVAAYEARDAALQGELASFASERTLWTAYYTSRSARAQTECSVTLGGAAAPAPAKPAGKQQQKKQP